MTVVRYRKIRPAPIANQIAAFAGYCPLSLEILLLLLLYVYIFHYYFFLLLILLCHSANYTRETENFPDAKKFQHGQD